MKIKAAVLREYNKPLSLEELELEPPKEKEVLVKYAYTGFCHSDLHNILGHTQMPTPMIQGHEARQTRHEQIQTGRSQRRCGKDASEADTRALGLFFRLINANLE
jgi:hypothetical protein